MQKINFENSKIEHIVGQKYIDEDSNNLGQQNQLNYDNLLAVCEGKSCHKEEHCDTNRSKFQNKYPQRKLFITPLENRIMQNIKFTSKGMIFYDSFTEIEEIEKLKDYNSLSEIENIKYDIQKVLNLNCNNLKEKRAILINVLEKQTNYWSNKKKIKELYNRFISNPSDEFSQVAIYHLGRKL